MKVHKGIWGYWKNPPLFPSLPSLSPLPSRPLPSPSPSPFSPPLPPRLVWIEGRVQCSHLGQTSTFVNAATSLQHKNVRMANITLWHALDGALIRLFYGLSYGSANHLLIFLFRNVFV